MVYGAGTAEASGELLLPEFLYHRQLFCRIRSCVGCVYRSFLKVPDDPHSLPLIVLFKFEV